MTNPWLHFLAPAFYLIAGGLLAAQLLVRGRALTGSARLGILALAARGLILHGALLLSRLGPAGDVNLALTSAFSLVAWVATLLFLLVALLRPIENLGILILPFTGLTVLAEWLWPGSRPLAQAGSPQTFHIVVSILAYGLLTLSAVQALLVSLQERRLHAHHPGGFVRALPPAQTMESLMFQLVVAGFLLLTGTVVSGLFFSEQVFGRPLHLNHHTVFAILGWAVYGILLFGRWRLGWRGRVAVRWTLAGFALLVIGYFGSKFVVEVLLGR
jgi:ABC-type uncharacterized transport system permease subunit